MCGFGGAVDLLGREIVGLEQTLGRIGDALAHRGPDDSGTWCNHGRTAGMVHRRLAINGDVHQPLAAQESCLAYNGELYGVGSEDTRFLFDHLLQNRRLTALTGMFAFAWWHEGHITLVRDRIGVKPLYYSIINDVLYFASEAKALTFLGDELDPEWFTDYRAFQVGLEGRTPWKHIRELQPGHRLVNGKLSRWWRLSFGEERSKHVLPDIQDLLHQAVMDCRLDHAAAYISGGLDSGVVGSIARLPAYYGLIPGYDESRYAIAIALDSVISLEGVRIDGSDFEDLMPEVIEALDYPVAGPGSYSQYKVAERVARRHKVVLSGNGGDEVFFGYARLAAAMSHELPSGYDALHGSLVGTSGVKERYRKSVTRGEGRESWFSDWWKDPNDINAMQRFELEVLLPGLLQVEDRVGMHWGLETRVPLLDHRLIEYVCSLDPSVRYDGNLKSLLKQASKGIVPDCVRMRKDKMGFPTPWWKWVDSPSRDRQGWGEWCLSRFHAGGVR